MTTMEKRIHKDGAEIHSLLAALPNGAHNVATPAILLIAIEENLRAPALIDLRGVTVRKPVFAPRPANLIRTQRHGVRVRRAHTPAAPARQWITERVGLAPIRQHAVAIRHAAVAQQDAALARGALGDRGEVLIVLAERAALAAVERVGARDERLAAVLRHVAVAIGVAGLALGSALAVLAGGDGVGECRALVVALAAVVGVCEGGDLAAVGVLSVAVGVVGFAAERADGVRAGGRAVGARGAGHAAVAAVLRVGFDVCGAFGGAAAQESGWAGRGVDVSCAESADCDQGDECSKCSRTEGCRHGRGAVVAVN